MTQLAEKRILLGISAGIAAYKAPILVRLLRAAGADVQVVMTPAATNFVTPTTLQAVSGHPVRQQLWDSAAEAAMGHIELARWADLVIIAPGTANTIARLAMGLADDLLSTLVLATTAPVYLAPAMNQQMYLHPASQRNLRTLGELGYTLLGPADGEQACGEVGPGRMLEPHEIVQQISDLAAAPPVSNGNLHGRRVMITAGPTIEAIDPVRFISNRSSGRQGIALAEAAVAAGASVTLIAGPGVPTCTPVVQRIDVTTACEMYNAVHQHLHDVDLFIGVAAVADYRPAHPETQKMKRSGVAQASLTLTLIENPDIIQSVAESPNRPAVIVGFAAETHDTLQHARDKRRRKGLDAVIVNDVSDPAIGFDSPLNAVTLIHAHGELSLPQQTKTALSGILLQHIVNIYASQLADSSAEHVPQ